MLLVHKLLNWKCFEDQYVITTFTNKHRLTVNLFCIYFNGYFYHFYSKFIFFNMTVVITNVVEIYQVWINLSLFPENTDPQCQAQSCIDIYLK